MRESNGSNVYGALYIPWEPKPAEILGFEKYLSFSDKTRGILTHSESTG